MAVVSTDKSILQTLEVFDIFSQENGKCLGFWISGRLLEVVAYERWLHLEVQMYLGCSYLFFTETLFALFFSTV